METDNPGLEISQPTGQYFFSILDSLSEGIQIIDFDWRYVYINDTVTWHGKTTKAELLGHTVMEKYPGIESTAFFKSMQQCMTGRKPQRLEHEIIYPDTSKGRFELSIKPITQGILIISKDITGAIIANEELAFQHEEKEKRAAELILANKELAFQNEEKGKRSAELSIANIELAFQNEEKGKRAAELMIANRELAFQNEEKGKRAAELTIANKELAFQNEEKEKRAAELTIANRNLAFQNEEKGKRSAELTIANKELAFQNEEKEKRASELTVANRELAFQNEEKGKRSAELTIANKELAFQNEEKEKRAAELIIINKELKKAENDIRKLNEDLEQKVVKRTAELEFVNKELESFSYSVSHDLRSPLRAIHGYASMLKGDYEPQLTGEAVRLMNNILNSSRKMGKLIDDLLAFSRLGRIALVKVHIEMDEIVSTLCGEIKKEQGNQNLQFKIGQIQSCQGDNTTIKQVWVNLISNAVKYSKRNEKTVIEISSRSEENQVIYSIKDNGAGFDMRYASKLFGVFQRLHTEDQFEGTGVGLAIVQRIITKHGGKVWAEGKVNEGATFYFSLPKNESI